MKKVVSVLTVGAAVLLGTLLQVRPASAISFTTYNIGPTSGNFGTVTLTQGSGYVDIKVQAANGVDIFGQGGMFGFNSSNPNAITGIDTISYTAFAPASGFTPSPGSCSSGQMDSFGSFGFRICNGSGSDGPNGGVSLLEFHVNGALVGDLGTLFAAQAGVGCTVGDNGKVSCPSTGYIGTGNPGTSVPEPSSLLLLSASMVGMGLRRQNRSNS